MSLLICSSHVLLGLPRCLLPSTMMHSILLTGASCVFLYTCPNYLNLFSRIFAERGATPNFSLNSWFHIISIIVLPHLHLSIRISVTSILCSKTFFTGQHSVPYNNVSLIEKCIILREILLGRHELLQKANDSISLKKFHKIALYFWNWSCRNINAKKS